jgi:type VII secretion integral membrane protein EccD
MPDSLCRVTIHSDGHNVSTAIDLALPSGIPLDELLPSIVDLVHADVDVEAADGRWRLHRPSSPPLDELLTLQENRVHDGDLLWLTTSDSPQYRRSERDASLVIAKAVPAGGPTSKYLSVIGGVASAAISAAALIWSARMTANTEHFPISAGLSAAAIAGALTVQRTRGAPLLCVTCGGIAVLFAAVAGALAVPAGPAAAHLLLASTAAFSVSTLLLRISSGTTALTALATITLLAGIVALASVARDLHVAAAGASLATLSLAALSVAPRVSITITRIGPAPPDADDPDTSPLDIGEDRVTITHATLTGLVTGSSVAAAVGGVIVAYGQCTSGRSPAAAVAFVTVIGIVLMLRARTHADSVRRCALVAGGSVCAAAAFVIVVVAAPDAAHWLSLLAATACAAALIPLLGVTAGPAAHRIAEISEYVALAAVVPLACWIGGAYGLVRDLALI